MATMTFEGSDEAGDQATGVSASVSGDYKYPASTKFHKYRGVYIKFTVLGGGTTLSGSVSLPAVQYSANSSIYWDLNTNPLAQFGQAGQAVRDAVTQKGQTLTGLVTSLPKLGTAAASDATRAGANALANLAAESETINAIGTSARVALNPIPAFQFKEVAPREFSFSWDFYPTNAEESQELKDIFKFLLAGAHPSNLLAGTSGDATSFLATSVQLLDYPSRFKVEFISGEHDDYAKKLNLPLFYDECVITNISPSYGSMPFMIYSDDGSPTKMGLELSIKETRALNREQIMQGF